MRAKLAHMARMYWNGQKWRAHKIEGPVVGFVVVALVVVVVVVVIVVETTFDVRQIFTVMCPKVGAVGHKGLQWDTWDTWDTRCIHGDETRSPRL